MARILVVTFDSGGNVPPMLGIASELRRRGHQVRVLGNPQQRDVVSSAGLKFVASAPWTRSRTRSSSWRRPRPPTSREQCSSSTGDRSLRARTWWRSIGGGERPKRPRGRRESSRLVAGAYAMGHRRCRTLCQCRRASVGLLSATLPLRLRWPVPRRKGPAETTFASVLSQQAVVLNSRNDSVRFDTQGRVTT